MSTKKTITESFRIRVGFVDDTYWDDGSRWTHRELSCTRRKERDATFREVMKSRIYHGQGQERESDFRVESLAKIEAIEVTREYDLDRVVGGKK